MPNRTVFYISDGTGITAETFGNAILAQFEITRLTGATGYIGTVAQLINYGLAGLHAGQLMIPLYVLNNII